MYTPSNILLSFISSSNCGKSDPDFQNEGKSGPGFQTEVGFAKDRRKTSSHQHRDATKISTSMGSGPTRYTPLNIHLLTPFRY